MIFKTLQDITDKFKITFDENDNLYKNIILDIFNGNKQLFN